MATASEVDLATALTAADLPGPSHPTAACASRRQVWRHNGGTS
ncbi:hypothetical protein I547_3264 [Mycobacterium kansasii 824]|nr:hypothetical protein I547_3264 [Mycobacterium kansasii 824]